MDKLTYKEAYNKIIEAYFKDEIQPLDSNFCFCGTLAGNKKHWNSVSYEGEYSYEQFKDMELQLLNTLFIKVLGHKWKRKNGHFVTTLSYADVDRMSRHPKYEQALFDGMCAALEVLRQIHIERGENVDEDIPAFTKRELAKAI